MNNRQFDASEFDHGVVDRLLMYAQSISRRGYVVNTLGNIAVRLPHAYDPRHGVAYTKHMGISLEEMTREHIVVTDIPQGDLLYGERMPSIGHVMNRTVFRHRPDINAVIHLHIDELIAYFTVTRDRELKYVSADTALVMARPAIVLEPNINVEVDASLLEPYVHETNCVIMPNHGITTFGRDISEAYHRVNSVVAEVRRIVLAMQIAGATGKSVSWICDEEVEQMYRDGERVIYGKDETS